MSNRLMRVFAAGLVSAALIGGGVIPAEAASPVPGRFCKSAEIGKVVKTAKYGKVKCSKDGTRARWKRL